MSDEIEDIADGLALWQEHKPQTREDWLRVAKRWHEVNDAPPEDPSPLFGALFDAVGEIARLRSIVADLIEGETAVEGTPQWYALRNARRALDA